MGKEDLDEFTAKKDKDVADVRKKHKLVLAETAKQLAVVRENEAADVLEVRSNAELVVAKLQSQRDVRLSQIRSGGSAEADKIKIETDTYVATKRADAQMEVAKNNAQSLVLMSAAEKFAAQQLRAKRFYEAKMRSLQSMRALATNNSVAIAGNSKDNVMAQLLANQQGGAMLGINQ